MTHCGLHLGSWMMAFTCTGKSSTERLSLHFEVLHQLHDVEEGGGGKVQKYVG